MNHDEKNKNNSQRGKRSSSTTDGRISSSSFSMEMLLGGSREISKEFSLVANVIDETQLEAEFTERMKKRMVEAVEIRPSHTDDEENPQTTSSNSSCSNSNSHINNSNNGENSIQRESVSASGTVGEASGKKMTSREKARLREKKRRKRCVCAWIGFFMAIAVLAAVLVLFLKFSKMSQNGVTDDQ
jgi:cobalamin biosynthesis Mg chelatase CobN